MKLIHDHHIHTVYSNHASPDMVPGAIIKQAERRGLRRIVILEHVPESPKYKRDVIEGRRSDFPRPQINAIAEESARCRGNSPVLVLLGAEVDADPYAADGSLLCKDLSGIDMVMASTHVLPRRPLYWYETPKPVPQEQGRLIYEEWMAWIMHVAANPVVDVLAHPGVEMAHIGAIESFSGAVLADFEKLLLVCKKYDTAFELNEHFKNKVGPAQCESYVEVIALARDLGVKLSIGSDSHALDKIGEYPWIDKLVARLGLNTEHFYHPLPKG